MLPKHATDLYALVPKGPVSNLAYRRELYRRAMREPEFAGTIRAACAMDPFWYLNCWVWTSNPSRPYPRKKVPFVTYEFQDRGLDVIFDSLEQILQARPTSAG